MGTDEQKEELGCNLMRSRSIFKAHASTFPGLYLTGLGIVEDSREELIISPEIDGKLMMFKYGRTNNMHNRLGDHARNFGKKHNCKMNLETFTYIDPINVVKAENELRGIFKTLNKQLHIGVDIDGKTELVTLNSAELIFVKQQFKYMSDAYGGSSQGFMTQILELERESDKKKQQYLLEQKEQQFKYEIIIQQQTNDLKYKDLELKFKDLQIEKLEQKLKI